MHKTTPLKPAQQLVLLLLVERPTYGVELLERLDERSHGAVRLNPGSLYRLLAQLVDAGLVRPVRGEVVTEGPDGPGAPRKLYEVTRKGRGALRAEAVRQAEWVEFARSLKLLEGSE